jgi:D-arabinose 1-dehydrogenase-like Zn-dependent alcohol dehydrogenase
MLLLRLENCAVYNQQYAKKSGAVVTCISSSFDKKSDAEQFGATFFVNSSIENSLESHAFQFDVIINTTCADLDWNVVLNMLKAEGTFVQVHFLKQIVLRTWPLCC